MQSFTNLRDDVISKDLCTKCGACYGVCDKIKSDKETHIPKLANECISCSKCVDICPGKYVDFNKLNQFVFNKNYKDFILGESINFYKGYSKKKEIFDKSTSGGFVTSLSIYLLENKLVDGVVMTRKVKTKPFTFEPFIAKTKLEVLSASGSKYQFIPVLSILNKLMKLKGNYAIVTLPCQTQALRKLQMNNPLFKKKIKYIIGLFCGTNTMIDATKYLIKKSGVNEENIKEISYRNNSWVGNFTIETKQGEVKSLDNAKFNFIYNLFTPKRCLQCIDLTNEFSDVSVGDAWHSDYKCKQCGKYSCEHQNIKRFVVITRNKELDKILQSKRFRNYINLKKTNRQFIIDSQRVGINLKKKGAPYRISISKYKPEYGISMKINEPPYPFYQRINLRLSSSIKNSFVKKIIFNMPVKLSRVLSSRLISSKIY